MAFPITNYSRVWVRGRIVDLAKAAREETSYGVTGPVQFTPSPTVLVDGGTDQVIKTRPFVVFPAALDGYFEIQLPATNDPDINPVDWTYQVVEPTGRTYNIYVPYDTPILYSPGDPLHDQPVIELSDVVPNPEANPGTIQVLAGQQGRSIASVTIDGAQHLVGTFSDGGTFDAGLMPVASVAGRTGAVVLTKADVGLSNVDNTADASKPVSTATATALSGKSDTSHTHAYAATSHTHAQADVTGLTAALAGKVGSAEITTIKQLTAAAYTDLTPKDAATLYVVVG